MAVGGERLAPGALRRALDAGHQLYGGLQFCSLLAEVLGGRQGLLDLGALRVAGLAEDELAEQLVLVIALRPVGVRPVVVRFHVHLLRPP
ncbi:MAG: hypothetical protein P8R46_06410 [Planctomycetota bacterium]|nr:hypothetical protein [Planctomycetota bacterium]